MADYYALVHEELEGAIEVFATRGEAEDALRQVLTDEPEWAGRMWVEPVDVALAPDRGPPEPGGSRGRG